MSLEQALFKGLKKKNCIIHVNLFFASYIGSDELFHQCQKPFPVDRFLKISYPNQKEDLHLSANYFLQWRRILSSNDRSKRCAGQKRVGNYWVRRPFAFLLENYVITGQNYTPSMLVLLAVSPFDRHYTNNTKYQLVTHKAFQYKHIYFKFWGIFVAWTGHDVKRKHLLSGAGASSHLRHLSPVPPSSKDTGDIHQVNVWPKMVGVRSRKMRLWGVWRRWSLLYKSRWRLQIKGVAVCLVWHREEREDRGEARGAL